MVHWEIVARNSGNKRVKRRMVYPALLFLQDT